MPDWDRGGPGGGGIGLPETERGPAGGEPGGGVPPFFGSSPIAGGALCSLDGTIPSGGFGSGFGVAVGGGAIVPSTTGLRESFDETMPFGISWLGSGSTSASASAPNGASGAASAATGSGASTVSASAAETSGSATGSAATGASSAFFAAAFFFGGGFLVETAFDGFGASATSSFSSSGGASRISPSRSALRRTRSACASTMLEE